MSNMVKDALGVPVEFSDRKSLKLNPVKNMQAYGTYNLPKGIWSDDTSLSLALMDSLITGLDYQDIINNFSKWLIMTNILLLVKFLILEIVQDKPYIVTVRGLPL